MKDLVNLERSEPAFFCTCTQTEGWQIENLPVGLGQSRAALIPNHQLIT